MSSLMSNADFSIMSDGRNHEELAAMETSI
jgi:hypothetical protein